MRAQNCDHVIFSHRRLNDAQPVFAQLTVRCAKIFAAGWAGISVRIPSLSIHRSRRSYFPADGFITL